MSREKALTCVLIGAVVGTLAGLTGIGGGVFLVPLLVGVLYVSQYEAHGTSLAVIFPMALSSAVAYGVMGYIDWDVFLAFSGGGVAGAFLGARLMKRIPERRLQWLFGLFVVCVGVVMITTHSTDSTAGSAHEIHGLDHLWCVLGGIVAGFLSGILGVGGGVVLIPTMVLLLGMDQHSAQGISLAAISAISFFGALTHFKQKTVRNDIAIYMAPSALCYGLLGSYLADQIDANILRDMVGGIIIIAGVLAVFRNWRAGGFAS
jgi:hypothetical protein